ncbi:MAG: peptidoglycan DD-metalloendopeptidase family protein [Litoreibacter sp.]|nr:peptidoglycan DD-metalloendopeptidase family protein [Litoreibacter sp.]MCY4333188.1 peptidoglycan DD-metalloendopeptidase family protein [Litoreibacter sp.]
MIRAALTAILLCAGTAAIAQSDPVITAKRAIQMLQSAATQLGEAQKSSTRVSALTDTLRAYEEGLSALREGLRRVAIRERAILLEFEAKEDQLSRLLGVLQTIERSPAPLLMMHPSGPIGTARSGMILSEVTPALQAEAQALKAQLEELSVLRLLQQDAADQITQALDSMQVARTTLSKAVADRTELPARVAGDSARMAQLVAAADTLQGFADSLATLGIKETADTADFSAAKGALSLPISGPVVTGFNETDAQGISRPGWIVAAEARTLVLSPWPATVRYAGPLLDYGAVVILEPGPGYLMILAGLGQPLVQNGQVVAIGEAVGIMGGISPTADSFLMTARKGGGGNMQESLYIEIRQDNAPRDPADWFEAE